MLDHIFYELVRVFLWVVFKLLGRIRVEGRGHVPRSGPALMVSNHISSSDPPVIGLASPRRVYFMAKEELFTTPILGHVLRLFKAFPVKRDSADRAAIRRAEELLRAGEIVAIFPEGREIESGEIEEFQPGTALLALRTGVPIVPVYLEGTDGVMPYGALMPRVSRKRVVVRFGAPLSLDDLANRPDRREALAEGTSRIRAAVIALRAR